MRWLEQTAVEIPEEFRAFVGGHPVVADRLFRLGFTTLSSARAFLDPSSYSPASPFELPDVEPAVKRLKRAISDRERILIWGDFDVDGQTATSLLFDALRRAGANVHYHVPLRQGEGHGIHLRKLEGWLSQGLDVIITCDTGITANDAVAVAQAAGVDVVITDHHMLGESLPAALAVINPMRLNVGHALRDLPGVGVAWQLISALSSVDEAQDLLDLTALGIVADVAIQARDTRYLLQRGLEQLRVSQRKGLRALCERAAIDPQSITEEDIGFRLGPRLNAQGRLGDAAASVELLTTNDEARAVELANQLEGMNAQRRLETQFVEDSAMSIIERDPSLTDYAAIVLSHAEWSGGIVGIVANRLAERFHKPVVLLNEGGDKASGSARSVPGCNITDAIRTNQDIVLRFGGHAMAAGLSIKKDSIYEFRRRLSRTVREMLPESGEDPAIEIDAYLRADEISPELALDLQRLAPYGNGNAKPNLVTRNVSFFRSRKRGSRANHLDLTVKDEAGKQLRLFWRNADESKIPEGRFDIAYTLSVDRSEDGKGFSMALIDFRPCENDSLEAVSRSPSWVLEDLSTVVERRQKLDAVLTVETNHVVWRELEPAVPGCTRTELHRADSLVIWTAPPGPDEWRAAVTKVRPQRIYFFGEIPEPMTAETFLRRLAGLAKHVLRTDNGLTTIDTLAAATAQRGTAVRYGLLWLAQTGALDAEIDEGGEVKLSTPLRTSSRSDKARLERLIRQILEETSAYRASGASVLR